MGQFGKNWHYYYIEFPPPSLNSFDILWFFLTWIHFVKCIPLFRFSWSSCKWCCVLDLGYCMFIVYMEMWLIFFCFSCYLAESWGFFLDSLGLFKVDMSSKNMNSFISFQSVCLLFFSFLLQWLELPFLCWVRMAIVYILAFVRS